MPLLKKILLFVIAFGVLLPASAVLFAADFYIAQNTSGADSGADCANAHGFTWFNNYTNWSNPKQGGKIGPGDTVHLCGTISCGGASSRALVTQASGTAGNPITILFETDSKLSARTCGKWLDLEFNNYIVVNGGSNGIIENTDTGSNTTYGGTYSYQNSTVGIGSNGGSNITIENLTIRNLYVRTPYTMDPNQSGSGIFWGTGGGHDIKISNVTVTNALSGMAFILSTGSNITIDSCTVLGANHFYEFAGGNGYTNIRISNSVADGMDVWEQSSPSPDLGFHRDGIFFHTDNSISNIYIYNNRIGPGFNPKTDCAGTAAIFFDGNLNQYGTYSNVYIFNNIFLLHPSYTTGWSGGGGAFGVFGNSGSDTTLVANNLFISAGGGNNGIQIAVPHGHAYNNILYGNRANPVMRVGNPNISYDMRQDATVGVDNNIYYNIANAPSMFSVYTTSGAIVNSSTLAQWQTACSAAASGSWDANSVSNNPLFVNPSTVVGTGDYHLQAGSPAIGTGLNLTLFATQVTNNDKSAMAQVAAAALLLAWDGKPRPAAGPWDIGPYQYQGPLPTLSPPSSLHLVK